MAQERGKKYSPRKTVTPTAPEVERAVLSVMLQFPRARVGCTETLTEDDFHSDIHRTIFEVIKKMADNNDDIDLSLLLDKLRSEGLLDRAGGPVYISELDGIEATDASSEAYIKTLKEMSLKRKLHSIGVWMTEEAYGAGVDAGVFAEEAERMVFGTSGAGTSNKAAPLSEVMQDVIEKVETLYNTKQRITGIPSDFYDLDEKLYGFQSSDLLILAARPAMGKTSFALNLLLSAAKHGVPSVFFSLEMPREQLAMRLLAVQSGIELYKIMRGILREEDLGTLTATATEMTKLPIFIDDTASLSVNALMSRARRLKTESDIGFLIVDYLQLMRGSGNTHSREQEISEISRSLKGLAKELKIPVMGLSQLNRGLESRKDRRPMLSDLRESGAIEQDADIVLFIYRDDVYDENSADRGKAEIIVSKHRNGSTGTITLGFEGERTAFYNLAAEDDFA